MRFLSRAPALAVMLLTAVCGYARTASGQAATAYLRYEVRGRLVDGANVRAGAMDVLVVAPEIGDSTTTDSSGRFVLRGVAVPGCFRVNLVSSYYEPTVVAFDLRNSPRIDLGPIPLDRRTSAGGSHGRGTCSPPFGDWPVAYGVIRGRIATRDGLPLPSEPVATECPALDTTRTDDAGYYRLDLVVPYSRRRLVADTAFLACRVWLPASGDTATAQVRFAPTPLAFAATVVNFGAMRLNAPYDVRLSGRVLDGTDGFPLRGAVVEVPDLDVRTTVNAKGAFALHFQSPAGCYRLSARYIGFAPMLRHLRISGSGSLPQGVIRLERRAMEMEVMGEAAPSDSGCTFTLKTWPWYHPTAFGEVIGRVTWADSAPFAYASVDLNCVRWFPRGEADASGYFHIDVNLDRDWGDSLAHVRRVTCRLVLANVPSVETVVALPLAESPMDVKAVVQLLVRPRTAPSRR